MRPKKLDDLNYYEILNIPKSSSQKEIEKAYRASKSAYGYGALASYGMVPENERREMQQRIEEAYHILRNPRRRRNYDRRYSRHETASRENAYFRETTEKMLIEDGGAPPGFWTRIRRWLSGGKKDRRQ